jgi:hypothetical protein
LGAPFSFDYFHSWCNLVSNKPQTYEKITISLITGGVHSIWFYDSAIIN